MSPDEVKHLAWPARQARTLASLERKVLALELEAVKRDPEGMRKDMPRNRAELRRWPSEADRFWAWSDPVFDRKDGKNAALIRRFYAALERIRAARRRGRPGLREDLNQAEERIKGLELQVARLVGENRQLRVEVRRLGLRGS